jgi:hypothetical protein
MTCSEARELIDPIASGDLESDPFRIHVAGCPACAGALAQAERIERALAALPAFPPPPRFSQAVRARVRRERWRYEERVDRAFNLTIAVGLVAVAAAVLGLLNITSLARMLFVAVETVTEATRQPAPQAGSLVTVGLPALLIAVAVAVWWWAERRVDYQET